jgi:hypothetical protein
MNRGTFSRERIFAKDIFSFHLPAISYSSDFRPFKEEYATGGHYGAPTRVEVTALTKESINLAAGKCESFTDAL